MRKGGGHVVGVTIWVNIYTKKYLGNWTEVEPAISDVNIYWLSGQEAWRSLFGNYTWMFTCNFVKLKYKLVGKQRNP